MGDQDENGSAVATPPPAAVSEVALEGGQQTPSGGTPTAARSERKSRRKSLAERLNAMEKFVVATAIVSSAAGTPDRAATPPPLLAKFDDAHTGPHEQRPAVAGVLPLQSEQDCNSVDVEERFEMAKLRAALDEALADLDQTKVALKDSHKAHRLATDNLKITQKTVAQMALEASRVQARDARLNADKASAIESKGEADKIAVTQLQASQAQVEQLTVALASERQSNLRKDEQIRALQQRSAPAGRSAARSPRPASRTSEAANPGPRVHTNREQHHPSRHSSSPPRDSSPVHERLYREAAILQKELTRERALKVQEQEEDDAKYGKAELGFKRISSQAEREQHRSRIDKLAQPTRSVRNGHGGPQAGVSTVLSPRPATTSRLPLRVPSPERTVRIALRRNDGGLATSPVVRFIMKGGTSWDDITNDATGRLELRYPAARLFIFTSADVAEAGTEILADDNHFEQNFSLDTAQSITFDTFKQRLLRNPTPKIVMTLCACEQHQRFVQPHHAGANKIVSHRDKTGAKDRHEDKAGENERKAKLKEEETDLLARLQQEEAELAIAQAKKHIPTLDDGGGDTAGDGGAGGADGASPPLAPDPAADADAELQGILATAISGNNGSSSVDELGRRFAEADKDGNGKLTMRELKACLKEWRPSLTSTDVLGIMSNVDEDGDGAVTYQEFVGRIAGALGLDSAAAPAAEGSQLLQQAAPDDVGSVHRPVPVDGGEIAVVAVQDNNNTEPILQPTRIDLPALKKEGKALAETVPKDKDGRMSKRAMKAAISGSPEMCAKYGFKQGRIQHFSEWFNAVDTDHDGTLSNDELDDWLAHHATHHSLAKHSESNQLAGPVRSARFQAAKAARNAAKANDAASVSPVEKEGEAE